MATATDIALLAPVPQVHLKSANDHNMTTVAFGTDCWDVLRELDNTRGGKNGKGGENVDVYIYASHQHEHGDVHHEHSVTWKARFVGWTEAVSGSHPNPMMRPLSTQTDGAWMFFWEVEDLARIDPEDIGKLQGWKNPRPYGRSFPPRHPVIIKHPGL